MHVSLHVVNIKVTIYAILRKVTIYAILSYIKVIINAILHRLITIKRRIFPMSRNTRSKPMTSLSTNFSTNMAAIEERSSFCST